MTAAETLAARLARCVDLFRDESAKDDQKAAFRALLDVVQGEGLHLKDDNGHVAVNGTAVDDAVVGPLLHRLELHNVAEIRVSADAAPAEVFELLRALADHPGMDDVPTRLAAHGAKSVQVTHAGLGGAPPPPESEAAAPKPPSGMGTEGILRGDPMTDIASRGPMDGVPLVTHDEPLPAPEAALPSQGTDRPSDALPAIGRNDPAARARAAAAAQAAAPVPTPPAPPAPPAPPLPPVPPLPPKAPVPTSSAPPKSGSQEAIPEALRRESAAAFGPSVARDQSTTTLLQQLAANPGDPSVGDLLAVLGRKVEDGVRANKIEQVLPIAAAIVEQEQRVPDGSARRHYGIALRRMYSKPLLHGLARLLSAPAHRDQATVVLRRGRAEAVEVLLDVLVHAPGIPERRAAFDALRQMTEGTEQLVQMLAHHEWFVVRNVAELVGEMGLAAAVPALTGHLGHEDERVRKAAALALAKIGTGNAVESLRRALKDKSPEVRMQVALGVGGRRSSALAMPLVVAQEGEEDEAVRRELLLALGRIGTPDAVQALIKIVQPAGRLFGRKPTPLRLAAVEGLRLAGTSPAIGTLEGLTADSDKQVRAAAEAAVQELKRKTKKG